MDIEKVKNLPIRERIQFLLDELDDPKLDDSKKVQLMNFEKELRVIKDFVLSSLRDELDNIDTKELLIEKIVKELE
jgi:hypothetical protein